LVSVGHEAGSTATMRVLAAVLQVLPDKGEGDAAEVRAAPDAADHHVGVLACEVHLLQRFLPDHGLVQEHVVEHAPEGIFRVFVPDRVLDGLGDRDA
jgi:hypothetical protein